MYSHTGEMFHKNVEQVTYDSLSFGKQFYVAVVLWSRAHQHAYGVFVVRQMSGMVVTR